MAGDNEGIVPEGAGGTIDGLDDAVLVGADFTPERLGRGVGNGGLGAVEAGGGLEGACVGGKK